MTTTPTNFQQHGSRATVLRVVPDDDDPTPGAA
jgi:hypothetical protein